MGPLPLPPSELLLLGTVPFLTSLLLLCMRAALVALRGRRAQGRR